MNNNIKPYSKDFNLVVLGQIVSIFWSSLLRFALSLYVLDMTGRADIFATLYAVSNIPRLLMPLGGAIADRFILMLVQSRWQQANIRQTVWHIHASAIV